MKERKGMKEIKIQNNTAMIYFMFLIIVVLISTWGIAQLLSKHEKAGTSNELPVVVVSASTPTTDGSTGIDASTCQP